MIKFDFDTYMNKYISKKDIKKHLDEKEKIIDYLSNGEMRGWYNLNKLNDPKLIEDIKVTAKNIRDNCDVFLVIGVGGSYMGARAVIESLSPYFYNKINKPEIYFLGHNLSSEYYHDLLEIIKDKKIIINVISKSGNTLEIKVGYEIIMKFMKNKYSDSELKNRVIITTDKHNGFLREEVEKHNFKSFVIPNNIGGRYSVFTSVGLLPIAVSGIDLEELFKGAKSANNNLNEMIYYATIRNELFKQKRFVESYVVYEPKLYYLTEWLKQLYGESLGKENKGILPISFINTRDLHSLGQFVQEGNKIIFETVINVENSNNSIHIDEYNKSLTEINNIVSKSVAIAHQQGDTPLVIIEIEKTTPFTIGYLLQFFMTSCAISGYIENINPFNQDGVEMYKSEVKTKITKTRKNL